MELNRAVERRTTDGQLNNRMSGWRARRELRSHHAPISVSRPNCEMGLGKSIFMIAFSVGTMNLKIRLRALFERIGHS